MKKFLLISSLILLAAGCNQAPAQTNSIVPPSAQTQNSPTEQSTAPSSTSSAPQNQIYENQYMKVSIPNGWIAKEAVKVIYGGVTKKTEPNPYAVNITQGSYILYINTQASQASGVEGGRFSEIASGAPSVDAVVTEQPVPPCGTLETSGAFLDFIRDDLYVSSKTKQDYCRAPANGSTVWYFSYLTKKGGGYFNYYAANSGTGLVVTMAYNSKDINKLPVKGSAELSTKLSEMTSIAKSLEIK